jgi:hypothetical protein
LNILANLKFSNEFQQEWILFLFWLFLSIQNIQIKDIGHSVFSMYDALMWFLETIQNCVDL